MSASPGKGKANKPPQPVLFAVEKPAEQAVELKVVRATNSLPEATLGDLGVGARVTGSAEFPLRMLIVPFDAERLTGLDALSVKVFRVDARTRSFQVVWNSGINVAHHFAWAKIRRPGVYIAIGLPRDRLLHEALRWLAQERRYQDQDSAQEMKALTARALEPYLNSSFKQLEQLRLLLTRLEMRTGLEPVSRSDLRFGHGASIKPFPLPHDVSLSEFRERLVKLDPPAAGLPEEALFSAPDSSLDRRPPWTVSPARQTPWTSVPTSVMDQVALSQLVWHLPFPICWLFSQDWWMYHADEEHNGVAAGCSSLTSKTVGSLILQSSVQLDHDVFSVPAIVGGKIYIGTRSDSDGGTLYKIDITTGTIEHSYKIPFAGGGVWGSGIGATPAVVNGRVFSSTLDGKIYCFDATNLTLQWTTDLRHPDLAHHQPVDSSNPGVGCWTSPLVVKGKVYVGVGLGEDGGGAYAATFGFIYCLSAVDGQVQWLFCTNKFGDVTNNAPNDIPHSLLSGTPPAPFTRHSSDPSFRGASVWSSCVYDSALDRIYVGTGNPYPDHPLPNEPYSSGVLSLDATTGQFRGFFQPDASDSYRPANDLDIDMPSSPTLFTRGGQKVLAIGSKNGGFFLLDPNTMTRLGSRQLLPYYDDDPSQPIPGVDPEAAAGPGENHSGMYGSAAVDYPHGYLFAGLGGWGGTSGIDSSVTPFMRAMHWGNALGDAWATSVAMDHVRRYTTPQPPMYTTPGELALSSPAVVNDVVFVTTNKPALYALDTATGACLWSAPGLPAPATGVLDIPNLGPAIFGDYVVIGCGTKAYIYTRRTLVVIPPWWYQVIEYEWPWPPPPPEGPGWGEHEIGPEQLLLDRTTRGHGEGNPLADAGYG